MIAKGNILHNRRNLAVLFILSKTTDDYGISSNKISSLLNELGLNDIKMKNFLNNFTNDFPIWDNNTIYGCIYSKYNEERLKNLAISYDDLEYLDVLKDFWDKKEIEKEEEQKELERKRIKEREENLKKLREKKERNMFKSYYKNYYIY